MNDQEDKNDLTAMQAALQLACCLTRGDMHYSVRVPRAAQNKSRFGSHLGRKEMK
jgi:hypothetical protein